MKSAFNYSLAEEKLGLKFKDKSLLKMAFTHSSFANENCVQSNERLEFLGDSVLGFIVTQKIYAFANLKEGQLSKLRSLLVSEEPLAQIVDSLEIESLMLKGIGESKNRVNSRAIKCDLFEAVVGAIFLDLGMKAAENFVMKKLEPIFKQVCELDNFEDAKTRLQEKLPHEKIKYITQKKGEDHNPVYESAVCINGVVSGKGVAGNKRSAEQMAASEAIKQLRKV